MSNWDASLESAMEKGRIDTLLPADFELPMVAPDDIGEEAARLLLGTPTAAGVHHVEGPARYTPRDVAAAFSSALERPVEAAVTAREDWPAALRGMGFSTAAAESFINMTELTLRTTFPAADQVKRGSISLQAYVDRRVAERSSLRFDASR